MCVDIIHIMIFPVCTEYTYATIQYSTFLKTHMARVMRCAKAEFQELRCALQQRSAFEANDAMREAQKNRTVGHGYK